MSRPLVLALSEDAHAHLVEAISFYVRQSRRIGQQVPPELVDLGRQLRSQISADQDGSAPARCPRVHDDLDMNPKAVTVEGAAHQLACSVPTVKRLIADGLLKAIKIRGATRVRVRDIDTYIAGCAPAATKTTTTRSSRAADQ